MNPMVFVRNIISNFNVNEFNVICVRVLNNKNDTQIQIKFPQPFLYTDSDVLGGILQ